VSEGERERQEGERDREREREFVIDGCDSIKEEE
jgi:hypothetical protein